MTQAPEDFPQEPPARDPGAYARPAPRVPDQRRASLPVEMALPAARPRFQVPSGYAPYSPRAEPKRSRLGTFMTVLALVASAVLAGGLVNGWRPALPGPETGVFSGAPVAPGEGTLPSPRPDAPQNEVLAYLREQAQLVLDAHAQSLLDGSLEGWLAAFDPTLHGQMTGRYETLRAMQISRFDYRISTGPIEDTAGAVPLYEVSVAVTHCFAEPAEECSPADVVFQTTWRDGEDGMVIVELEPSEGRDGPHPWEVDDLIATVGDRTVVAAPPHMEDQLDEALEVAEGAAVNADKWALWEDPDRYVVYIATDDEFEVWFGGLFESGDVLGFALPLEGTVDGQRVPTTYATVMNVDRTGWGYDFTSVMRHELGHAVTLWASPSERYTNDTWWMVEGIAEYIDHGDKPVDQYDRIWDVEDHVADGGCADEIVPPEEDDDTLTGSGKYGCAFLGVHYMIDAYGVDDFTEWFETTAREGQPASGTAEQVYGKNYADLMEEITAFIAQTVLDRLLPGGPDCRNMSNIPIERHQRHGQ